MSASVPTNTAQAAIAKASNTTTLVQGLQTAAINGAKDVPETARAVATLDPELNAYLDGKSLLGSKTIWFPLISAGVSWVVGRYALGWSADVMAGVSGLISYGVVVALRYVTSVPITSILPKSKS